MPERISQNNDRAQITQNGRMEDAILRLRSCCGTCQNIGERRRYRQVINLASEIYAKENDIWITLSDIFNLGIQGPSGNENDTYFSPDGYVYKVNNLMNSGDMVSLFEHLYIHNQLFPETAYELVGFTGFEGRSTYPIIRQRAVYNPSNASLDDINEYMHLLGFHKNDRYSFCNGEIIISDLRPRNVLKDTDGDIYIIDADFKITDQSKDKHV